jgi:hypothetical protein
MGYWPKAVGPFLTPARRRDGATSSEISGATIQPIFGAAAATNEGACLSAEGVSG